MEDVVPKGASPLPLLSLMVMMMADAQTGRTQKPLPVHSGGFGPGGRHVRLRKPPGHAQRGVLKPVWRSGHFSIALAIVPPRTDSKSGVLSLNSK